MGEMPEMSFGFEPLKKRLRRNGISWRSIIRNCHLLISCKLGRCPLVEACLLITVDWLLLVTRFLSLLEDEIDAELQGRDTEIKSFLKIQEKRMKNQGNRSQKSASNKWSSRRE